MAVQHRESTYIRVVHPSDYDFEKKRFASTAFQVSSNEGISVFERDCGIIENGSECAHIEKYYREQTGDPSLFWPVPDEGIPDTCEIVNEASSTGDACHRDIKGWHKNRCKKYFKNRPNAVLVCYPDGVRAFDPDEYFGVTREPPD
ncbi:MAG TPA: hypothetical protein VMM38_09260 [Aridibacter sp.]|nr:hypothetical protein [Aridibacter sp.]